MVDGIGLNVRRIRASIVLPVVEIDGASARHIHVGIFKCEAIADDLDGFVVARDIGSNVQPCEGDIVRLHEDAAGAKVVGGVGRDVCFERVVIHDGGIAGIHTLNGDAIFVDEQPELVRPVSKHEAIRGGLVIVTGKHAHRAACAHRVDRGLDSLLRIPNTGAAIRVISIDSICIADRGAWWLWLEVVGSVCSTNTDGESIHIPVKPGPWSARFELEHTYAGTQACIRKCT